MSSKNGIQVWKSSEGKGKNAQNMLNYIAEARKKYTE